MKQWFYVFFFWYILLTPLEKNNKPLLSCKKNRTSKNLTLKAHLVCIFWFSFNHCSFSILPKCKRRNLTTLTFKIYWRFSFYRQNFHSLIYLLLKQLVTKLITLPSLPSAFMNVLRSSDNRCQFSINLIGLVCVCFNFRFFIFQCVLYPSPFSTHI